MIYDYQLGKIMQKLHDYVLDKIFKSAILPIVAVEFLLIVFIFAMSFYQGDSNKALILERSNESFETLSFQVAKRMEQEFENVEKDATALKEIIQTSFENQRFYAKSDLNFRYAEGFYLLDNSDKASVYTTNISELTDMDKKSLELLFFAISPIDALSKEYKKKIDAVWVNLGKYYSLYYPKISVKDELSPDLDSTQQSYYFQADAEHNPQRKTIFIPLFNEPWALGIGQIGAVVSPIYKEEQMQGVVGISLTAENTEKLSAIELPFNAYVMIADKEGYLLFSSNEEQSRKDFSVSSFTGLYKEGKKEALKKIDCSPDKNIDCLLHQHMLGNTGLNLILVTKKSEVSRDVVEIFDNAQSVSITVLLFVVLLHLFLFGRLKYRAANMTSDITKPISDIADASKKLFQEEDFSFNKSNIEELTLLHENLEKAHHKLINQLYFDALTGLPNQRKLLLDIEDDDILILISVDNFKNINNVYGPKIGDEVLSLLVEELKRLYRTEAALYRVNNDVFALLIHAQSALSHQTIEMHYEKIKSIKISKDEIAFALSFSLSYAKNSLESGFSLLAQAEIALDEAQKQEHLRCVVFDASKHVKDYNENFKWAKKLQDAFEQKRLVAYFQPIYNMKRKGVHKFESLVRMMDGDKAVSPFFFLGAAARMGKLSDISRLMLREVFEVASTYPDVDFSINVSFEDFIQADLLPEIKKLHRHYHLSGSHIIFEFLETGTLSNEEKIIETVAELKALGCKIAIDDFGTGNSNFAHLMLMQVDYIKIDGQFIKNINTDQKSLDITKTIKAFADMTGAKTIAEFVCDKEVFEKVGALEIDFAQGYYVSEPRPASQIGEMLSIKGLS